MFEALDPAPPDAILGLTDAFRADPRPEKINLGVGVYQDDSGRTPVLNCVKRAEELLLSLETSKTYLPITGSPAYADALRELLLGREHPLAHSGRVQCAQTPGGTGGLRVGADLLRKYRPGATVWVSRPTWANHPGVFKAAGFPVKEYAYFDAAVHGLDFDALAADLEKVPAGDIVLLHVCCHNPTGADPTPAQWEGIADIAARAGWFPFFDFAYQGFGLSLEADRGPLLTFAARDLEFVVSSSFSKNFGLYNERVGAFSLVARDAAAAASAFSHVKATIRVNYSNPPRHGGAVVEQIMTRPDLREQWIGELDGMRERIRDLRLSFAEGMRARGSARDFSFITRQHGMFSFSGLNAEQVERLRRDYGIYVVGGGRVNVAGINSSNLDRLCDAIAEVTG